MSFFKPITARRLYKMLDEVVKKHQGNPDAINLDAPIYVCIPADEDGDEEELRNVISIGGDVLVEGLVITLFDTYGD